MSGGFPHSEIIGSKLIRSSPTLIAAYHVLHRLTLPRHSPNALIALDSIQKTKDRQLLIENTFYFAVGQQSADELKVEPDPHRGQCIILGKTHIIICGRTSMSMRLISHDVYHAFLLTMS